MVYQPVAAEHIRRRKCTLHEAGLAREIIFPRHVDANKVVFKSIVRICSDYCYLKWNGNCWLCLFYIVYHCDWENAYFNYHLKENAED